MSKVSEYIQSNLVSWLYCEDIEFYSPTKEELYELKELIEQELQELLGDAF